jgi:hypothetical protein
LRATKHEAALRSCAAGHDRARWRPAGRVAQLSNAFHRNDMAGPDAIDGRRLLVTAGDPRLVFAELREQQVLEAAVDRSA